MRNKIYNAMALFSSVALLDTPSSKAMIMLVEFIKIRCVVEKFV